MSGPRVLVTGFEPFPGAPFNPTEWLVGQIRQAPPAIAGMGELRAELLPVSYAAVGPRLAEIGEIFRPQIAVHFGLARTCRGFRLERSARNSFVALHPDNRGFIPEAGPICAGPESFASTLPLEAIHDALSGAGMPVEWSDDAGGYLCNTVFALSAGHACGQFRPEMSGFIHVPPIEDPAPGRPQDITFADLLAGARLAITACVQTWNRCACRSAALDPAGIQQVDTGPAAI